MHYKKFLLFYAYVSGLNERDREALRMQRVGMARAC